MAPKARSKSPRAGKTAKKSNRKGETLPRAALARETKKQITRFGLNRELAAVALDDAATQMSRLMSGHYQEFSADRLVRYLLRLGSDVSIKITHARRLGRRGKLTLNVGQ